MAIDTRHSKLSVLALALLTACIGPPPGAKEAALAGGAPGGATTAAKPNKDGVLVIWDGDGAGAGAKGWASCNKKPCTATAAPTPAVGRNGSAGLKIHFEGPDWIGMGWNWFGWWPETAGTDISAYKNLKFWMRIEAKSPEMAPDLTALNVNMRCSNGKKDSAFVTLKPFAQDSLDGQWHEVVIPLSELTKGKGSVFDLRTAWEFGMSTWSGSPRDFTIYVDDIAATP